MLFLVLLCSALAFVNGQQIEKNVLFLGNSYTQGLPGNVKRFADEAGFILNFEKNTPGGYTFKGVSKST